MEQKVNPLHELLIQDVSKISEATTVLSRLWRLTLYEARVTPLIWDINLSNYSEKAGVGKGCKEALDFKGNILKALVKPIISWNRFCQAVTILAGKETTITIECKSGDITYKKVIPIPSTIEECRNDLLGEVWKEVVVSYSERHADWRTLIKQFNLTAVSKGCNITPSMAGNLRQTLKSDEITWNVFYSAMRVMNFDELKITLTINRHRTSLKI